MADLSFTKDDYKKFLEENLKENDGFKTRISIATILNLLIEKGIFTEKEFEDKFNSLMNESINKSVEKVTGAELDRLSLMKAFGFMDLFNDLKLKSEE